MSALTDLFTALANKIRSKTGTATTYTPLQMVSDGIDDVYAAGYDAGGGGATGIPITPSNASPVSLTTGDSYEMLSDGYAIASYNNLSPSNVSPAALADDTIYKTNGTGYAIDSYSSITPSNSSPASLTSGSIYKMGGAGAAIASYSSVTPSNSSPVSLSSGSIYKMGGSGKAVASVTDITPSDSSPAAMTSGAVYKAGGGGYAIASNPTSVTPTSSGASFSSGMVKMASSGYAYSSKPTGGFDSGTTLWSNSSPTSSFSTQTVTLNQSIENFDYIKFNCRGGTSSTTTGEAVYSKEYAKLCVSGNNNPRMIMVSSVSSSRYVRTIIYVSATQMTIDNGHKYNANGDTNSYCIPTSIVGYKFTP